MSVELTGSPDELRQRFFELRTFDDLASLLEVQKSQLYYYAFIAPPEKHYKIFIVPKKNGGIRVIAAPASPLKIIQAKLNQVLQQVYLPKASVHGFVLGRSILTNANRHLEGGNRKRYIFNIDLENFFPSITYARILGLLCAKPYELPKPVAKVIAQLSCLGNSLPQGAPTSPVLANMICAKMDTQLKKLAQESKCIYTRYADDITFSTSLPKIPASIATTDDKTGQLIVGQMLDSIITANGFRVNSRKVRLQTKFDRQEVTGLTVNKFPNVRRTYIRQIRAMLHAWEKYGLDKAQKEFSEKYNSKRHRPAPSFKQVVRGKIEFLRMVRGEDSPIYLRFRDKLSKLDTEYKIKDQVKTFALTRRISIATEGRSDWKHLKAALKRFQAAGEFTALDIEFWEYEEDPPMNDSELLNRCRVLSKTRLNKTQICIFDRDKSDVVKQVAGDGADYRKWSIDLFSFPIPVPSTRLEAPDVCMELYYTDADIKRRDSNGRRLFLSTEFDKKSCRHMTENLNCTDPNKVKRSVTIIDNSIFDDQK
jgi:RNA-directed DNA polymerase